MARPYDSDENSPRRQDIQDQRQEDEDLMAENARLRGLVESGRRPSTGCFCDMGENEYLGSAHTSECLKIMAALGESPPDREDDDGQV